MQFIRNIKIKGADDRLFAADIVYTPNNEPKPVVVFIHGFKGFKDWGPWDLVAREFAGNGFVFIKFNFSHNGTTLEQPQDFADLEAFGNNNFGKELFDLGCVIDMVVDGHLGIPINEFSARQMFLIGHSRGGGIGLIKTFKDSRVKKLATWASVNRFDMNWLQGVLDEWKSTGVMFIPNSRTGQQMPLYWQIAQDFIDRKPDYDIPELAAGIEAPVLIVHGTEDTAVSYEAALDLKTRIPKSRLLTVENGDHVFGASHPYEQKELPNDLKRVVQKTISFFKN